MTCCSCESLQDITKSLIVAGVGGGMSREHEFGHVLSGFLKRSSASVLLTLWSYCSSCLYCLHKQKLKEKTYRHRWTDIHHQI